VNVPRSTLARGPPRRALFSSRLSLCGFAQGFASLLLSPFHPAPIALKADAMPPVTDRAARFGKASFSFASDFRQFPILVFSSSRDNYAIIGKSSSGTLERSLFRL